MDPDEENEKVRPSVELELFSSALCLLFSQLIRANAVPKLGTSYETETFEWVDAHVTL